MRNSIYFCDKTDYTDEEGVAHDMAQPKECEKVDNIKEEIIKVDVGAVQGLKD